MLDTRVIYCGDCLDQFRKLPAACIDLIYIDPPFNSNRNYEVFWAEPRRVGTAHLSPLPPFSSPRRRIRARAEASGHPAPFADRHASTQAYIEFMRPRCVELARVLKKTGSFYYHCDWHAGRYVSAMLVARFGEKNLYSKMIGKRTSAPGDWDPASTDSCERARGNSAHLWPSGSCKCVLVATIWAFIVNAWCSSRRCRIPQRSSHDSAYSSRHSGSACLRAWTCRPKKAV